MGEELTMDLVVGVDFWAAIAQQHKHPHHDGRRHVAGVPAAFGGASIDFVLL